MLSSCKYGPMTIKNNPACILCNHIGCSSCTTEACDAAGGPEGDSTYVSNSMPAIMTRNFLAYDDDCGFSNDSPMPIPRPPSSIAETWSRDTAMTSQLGLSASPSLFAPNAIAQPDQNVHPEEMPVEGGEQYVWYCCACGGGPHGIWRPTCNDCSRHNKCKTCKVEVITSK